MTGIKSGNSILDINDLKSFIRIFSKNWYIIIFAIVVSASLSHLYSYKISAIYAAQSQILLKSTEVYDYQDQLYRGLGYLGIYGDITNQKRVITSRDIVAKAFNRLNFDISYFIVGRFKTTEVYASMPFEVSMQPLNKKLYERPISFKIVDINNYEISYEINDEIITRRHEFNKEVDELDYFMTVKRNRQINKNSIDRLKKIDYQFIRHSREYLIGKYKRSLNVENIEYTSILVLTVEDEIAQRAKTFLDTLSKVYIDYTLQSQLDINANTLNYIDIQLNEITGILTNIENDLENYKAQKSILDLSKEENEYFSKLVDLESQKRNIELQQGSIEALEDYIFNSSDQKLLPPTAYIMEGDDFLEERLNELYSLQMSRNSALFESTEKSMSVYKTDQEIDLLKKNILTYLRNTKNALAEKKVTLEQEINTYEQLIRNIPKSQRDIININRKLLVNEKMYLFLLEKRANTVIARAGIVPHTKIIERARSIGMVRPNKTKILYSFTLVGIIISLLFIFIRTVFFERVENSEQLKMHTTLPVYGEIIFAGKEQEEYIVVDADPKSAITESFRAIRTNLEYLMVDSGSRVVLTTSYRPNEGKTFCSINLAAILAKAGKKVLLLELDLHKPKVGVGLDLKSDIGISSVLIGKAKVDEVIMKTRIDNLNVIISGPTPPNASEIILSDKLAEIIKYGREHYDYVLIDTPPVGLITDALVMMKYVDATLFVLNTKFSNGDHVRSAIEMVENNSIKNFGFILNGVKAKNSKYYSYKYGYKSYGYSYGNA